MIKLIVLVRFNNVSDAYFPEPMQLFSGNIKRKEASLKTDPHFVIFRRALITERESVFSHLKIVS